MLGQLSRTSPSRAVHAHTETPRGAVLLVLCRPEATAFHINVLCFQVFVIVQYKTVWDVFTNCIGKIFLYTFAVIKVKFYYSLFNNKVWLTSDLGL